MKGKHALETRAATRVWTARCVGQMQTFDRGALESNQPTPFQRSHSFFSIFFFSLLLCFLGFLSFGVFLSHECGTLKSLSFLNRLRGCHLTAIHGWPRIIHLRGPVRNRRQKLRFWLPEISKIRSLVSLMWVLFQTIFFLSFFSENYSVWLLGNDEKNGS